MMNKGVLSFLHASLFELHHRHRVNSSPNMASWFSARPRGRTGSGASSSLSYISDNYPITVSELKMDVELNIEHLVRTLVLWLYFPLNLACIYMLT